MVRLHTHPRARRVRRLLTSAALPFAALLLLSSGAAAIDRDTRQSLEDAWWTGPILAASAASAQRGHFMVEPYFYDNIVTGRYDQYGARRSAPRSHSARAATFIMYGISDRLSVGVIPTFGFNWDSGRSPSTLGFGDISLQAQYQLTDFQEGRLVPTTSLLITATIPTGRYDHLGTHPDDGLGSGAFTWTASLYSQYYFWLPTGRILRTRLDLSYSISDRVDLHDVSVYGTPRGFDGRAAPGDSFAAYVSGEYSVTRNWVLAAEVAYQHADNTRVTGRNRMADASSVDLLVYQASSGSSRSISLAPEIEYNWSGRVGLLAGVIFTVSGRNVAESITPAVAINYYL